MARFDQEDYIAIRKWEDILADPDCVTFDEYPDIIMIDEMYYGPSFIPYCGKTYKVGSYDVCNEYYELEGMGGWIITDSVLEMPSDRRKVENIESRFPSLKDKDREKVEMVEKDIRDAIDDYFSHAVSGESDRIYDAISDEFIENLAHDNVRAKSQLRDFFRKGKDWNEELDSYIIDASRTHEPDPKKLIKLIGKLFDLPGKDLTSNDIDDLNVIKTFLSGSNVDQDKVEAAFNRVAPDAYVKGKKLSRVLKSVCDVIGITDNTKGSKFQALYSEVSNEMNAKKIDFRLFITPSAASFLTMSNPKNDERGNMLTSCHSLNSLEYDYNCGCSGYARDMYSFLVYTCVKPDQRESRNSRKTTRQVFSYVPGNGVLLQSRLYNSDGGTSGNEEEMKIYRELIQKVIAELEGSPNLWVTRTYENNEFEDENGKHFNINIEIGDGYGGYADWTYPEFGAKVSILRDHLDTCKNYEMGAAGLCVVCGDETTESLTCDDCNIYQTCDDCGEEICGSPNVITIDNHTRVVCDGCAEGYSVCDFCDHTVRSDTMTETSDGEYVCESCLEEYYRYCGDCGRYVPINEMREARDYDGNIVKVCEDCLDEDYVRCNHCSDYVHEDDEVSVVHDGEETYKVCKDCAEAYVRCSKCGELWNIDDYDENCEFVCPDCVKEEAGAA